MTTCPARVLVGCFALAIAACADKGDDGVAAGADLNAAAHPAHPTWDGTGPKTTLRLGVECTPDSGCKGTKDATFQAAGVQAALADALKTQDQNVSAESATYTDVPAQFLGDPTAAAAKNDAFQLMFRSDGRDLHDAKSFGAGLASSETLKCSTITGAKVAAAVAKFHGVQAILSDDQDDNAKQAAAKLKSAIGDAVKALVDVGASGSLFQCSWDNHDDSDAGAILSIDSKASTVRVLFVFNGG